MSHGDDVPPDDVEFLDAGPELGMGTASRLHRRPKLLLFLVAAAAVTVAAIAVVRSGGSPAGYPTTPPRATDSRSSVPGLSPTASSGVVFTPPVSVTILGHPLLGVRAGWEMFGRGPGVVVRIQFARGRITRTAYPALSSGAPVTFVTDAEGALVRPIDFVPGYFIPDGEPAREVPGALDAGGPVFPGPDPRHLWVASTTSDDRMVLVGMDGRRTGPSIAAPPQGSPVSASLLAVPDQTGYLLFPGTGGIYDVRPGGTSRVTTGTVLAVGPTRWLTAECDSHAHCRLVVTDRSTGVRHPLSTHPPLSTRINGADLSAVGVISPDGPPPPSPLDRRRQGSRSSTSLPAPRMRFRSVSTCPEPTRDGLGKRWSGHRTAGGCSSPPAAISTRSAGVPARSPTSATRSALRCRNCFSYRCETSGRARAGRRVARAAPTGRVGPLLREFDIPGLYLSWPFRVPAVYLGLPSAGPGCRTAVVW